MAEPKRRYGAPLPGGNLDNRAKKSKKSPPRQGLGRTPWWHGYVTTFGLIEAHPDRDARPRALLSSCLAEITAEVVSPGPSKLPKAATPMV